jgi:uncharacterized protein YjbI with pentapeptide repeats
MRILIEPYIRIDLTVDGKEIEQIMYLNSEGVYNINNIRNIVYVKGKIEESLHKIFPEEQRIIEELGNTSLFSVNTLENETRDNINEWINNYNNLDRLIEYSVKIFIDINRKKMNGILCFKRSEREEGEYPEVIDDELSAFIKKNGKDLSNLNLVNVNLDNVLFSFTDYSGTNFSSSEMKYSNCEFGQFVCANFTGSNLTETDFRSANLSRANFTGADIEGADFRGCILTGADFTDVTFNGETKFDSSIVDDLTIRLPEDLVQAILSYEVEDEFADIQYEPTSEDPDGERLSPLEIVPDQQINEGVSGNTYGELVKLLAPSNTKKVKLPISRMEMDKWYGISSLGNTSPDVWSQLNVVEPLIGKVFQCIFVPEQQEGESMVYETVAPCMAVHNLAGGLDKRQIIQFFDDTIPNVKTESAYHTLLSNYPEPNEQLNYLSKEFFNLLMSRLGKHNADETEDSWTHVYDDIELRKTLVKHAIFHVEEGIKNHPLFDKTNRFSGPIFFLIIQEFLKVLPIQVQVVWAQNYIQEFITGYGQTLDTFDPTLRSPEEFIASCLNGNLEKLIISIVTGVTHFYKFEREIEGEEQQHERLLDALLGSEFQNYYGELIDEGPTLQGFITHINKGPIISENDREKYIEILNDPNYKRQIEENINIYTGGRRRKHNTRKYIKKRKAIKGTKNNTGKKTITKKQMKKIKTIKKRKNTLKKGKHIKRRKTIKRTIK